jgi:uncharacterized protein
LQVKSIVRIIAIQKLHITYMDISKLISQELNINLKSVQNTINLLNEDCTVPFIARYRKELTHNLDEVAIFEIQKRKKQFEELEKRKESIIKALEEQGVLTDELKQKIYDTYDATTLEDIYLPYKKKRKTKAETARKNGLEPLAKQIMAQRNNDIELAAERYINDQVPNTAAALEGARFIIAEWINENIWVRNYLRRVLKKSAKIKTKVVKSKESDEKAQKYQDYFDWEEPISRCPSHRLLAMLRAEKEGFIRLKLSVDKDMIFDKLDNRFIKSNNSAAEQIEMAITDAYKRLLEPSIGTETINYYKQQADKQSIKVFSENLKQLLLSSPLGEKNVLGIDPGFRTGCKIVCINQQGDLLHNDTIYPHPPQNDKHGAVYTIQYLVDKYNIESIAIGNGTASRETEQLVKSIKFDEKIPIFVVSEAGASIYSASKVAREEFPDKDVTVRGAVSIARRLQDPLAELVKIDAKSIGVGQYQHDVDQQLLKEELDTTVVSSVNLIGVNVNTASKHLLKYVSGIGEKLAENIVNYRSENGSVKSRAELKKVKRLGDKAFEQSAGFLRIKNGTNPLDDSAVHPESYMVVKQMAKHLGVKVDEMIGNKELLSKIPLQNFVSEKTGLLTLKDIIKELIKPGVDIREKAKIFEFSPDLKDINDVKVGEYYPGIINNITNFGCFVDIGIKESGLVHISNLANQFVSNPNEIVKLNQTVRAKVISVDVARKRIGLSLKE